VGGVVRLYALTRFIENLLGCFGPREGAAAVVPLVDEGHYGADEVLNAATQRLNAPLQMAQRVMIPKKISSAFIHDPEIAVLCLVMRGFSPSQASTLGRGSVASLSATTCKWTWG
jgi:hypothetical protein